MSITEQLRQMLYYNRMSSLDAARLQQTHTQVVVALLLEHMLHNILYNKLTSLSRPSRPKTCCSSCSKLPVSTASRHSRRSRAAVTA
jgi:hypothetical protein